MTIVRAHGAFVDVVAINAVTTVACDARAVPRPNRIGACRIKVAAAVVC